MTQVFEKQFFGEQKVHLFSLRASPLEPRLIGPKVDQDSGNGGKFKLANSAQSPDLNNFG